MSCRVSAVFVFRKSLFIVRIAPKPKISDAGSASKPKRIRDVLSISEMLKFVDMIEIEKMVGNEFLDRELMKNKEKIHSIFFLHGKLQNLVL